MSWLDNYSTTNTFRSMYINGFIDISGGRLQTRSVTDGHLFIAGDTSLNGNLYVGGDISWNPNNLADNSIPSSAIIGGVGGSGLDTDVDLSLNKRLFVGEDVTLNKRLFVGGDVSLSGTLTLTETNPVTFLNTSSLEMPFMVFNFTQICGMPAVNKSHTDNIHRWDDIFPSYSKLYTNMHTDEIEFYNQNDGQFGVLLFPGIWEVTLAIPAASPNRDGIVYNMGLDEDAGRDFDSDESLGNMYNVHPSYGQGGPEKHIVHVPFDGDNSGSSTSAKAKVFHLQMLGDNRQFRIRNNSANANIYPVFNLRCLHAAPWDGTIYKSNQWFSKTSSITQVNVNNNAVKWPRK